MIYVGITDARRAAFSSKELAERLPVGVLRKIEGTKNEREKKLRLAAYLTLGELYSRLTSKVLPEISFADGEKPCFVKESDRTYSFNISHDRDFAVAAISDGEVGVDIQSMPERRLNIKRAVERLFSSRIGEERRVTDANLDADITFFKVCGTEIKKSATPQTEMQSANEATADPLARWTALEAVLKLDGVGFAPGKEPCKDAKTKTLSFGDGKDRYVITVAVY